MLSYETISTVSELIEQSAVEYGDLAYMQYLKNGKIEEITFTQFSMFCKATTAWVKEQSEKKGHKIRVALYGKNNPEYVQLMLGVVCGGGVSIPIDVQADEDTICAVINKSEADILLYDINTPINEKSVLDRCSTLSDIKIMNDPENSMCEEISSKYSGTDVISDAKKEECALILFTSGTTGEGKGVMLSNGNLIDNVFNSEFKKFSKKLNILPINHAFCIKGDFLISFATGSTVCINGDMKDLAQNILLFEPTIINLVPMVAQGLFTKLEILAQKENKTVAQLRDKVFGSRLTGIYAGGAHLPEELVHKYKEAKILICQGYGMTECSPTISTPDPSRPDKAYTAGRIAKRCQTRIVNGELQVKSPSVMMGYCNDPEKTAEVITEDGWLRTGDLGYVDSENFLHITGRIKNLIILGNGENVSPEQLENKLLDHQLIQECLVHGDENIITAEIFPDKTYVNVNMIKDVVAATNHVVNKVNAGVPSYKKIMRVVVRKTPFEKTGTNKIKRNRRCKPEDILSSSVSSIKAPENYIQKLIYSSVKSILGHSNFGIENNLFEAGLDSLGSTMLVTDLAEKLNINISLDDIVSNPTIIMLENLFALKKEQEKTDLSARPSYELTNLQKFFVYILKGATTSNVSIMFKLGESVDLERMKKAAEQLFEIHPILKNVIEPVGEKYMNIRNDDLTVDIPIFEMSDDDFGKEFKTLPKNYYYTKGEPLHHISIYKTESAKYLLIDIAHIISDGYSLDIIIEDLEKLYNGQTVEKEKHDFYELILENTTESNSQTAVKRSEYLSSLMNGLKLDRSILNKKGYEDFNQGKYYTLRGVLTDIDRLKGYCKEHSISENTFFLTAFNYCINIFSNRKDTLSTSIHSGRTDSRWTRTVGSVFSTYNFRYTFDNTQKVSEMLRNGATQILDTMRHHVSTFHADEMFFQYQGKLFEFSTIGNEPVQIVPMELDGYPFHFIVMDIRDTYKYELRFLDTRYDQKQLEIFVNIYNAILSSMLNTEKVSELRRCVPLEYIPNECIADISMLKGHQNDFSASISVLDDDGHKQPYGAWGNLYANGEPVDGVTARIMSDNTLDFLENSGRCVMSEGLTKRRFFDLNKLEEILMDHEDISDAYAYMSYGPHNVLYLSADITVSKNITKEDITMYLAKATDNALVPSIINLTYTDL